MMPWYLRAWAWLKKNWPTVLLGISTLGIGLFFSRIFKKDPKVEVLNPELVGHEDVRLRAERDAQNEKLKIEVQRSVELSKVEQKHREIIAKLTETQRREVDEFQGDPEALNELLLRLGKEIRSDNP